MLKKEIYCNHCGSELHIYQYMSGICDICMQIRTANIGVVEVLKEQYEKKLSISPPK